MAASVFDSPLFAKLFACGDTGRLFTDSAMIRAMLLVEGTLAKVQGELGVIPEDSAFFIHRASMEIQIDPGSLSASTGQNGVSVPGLVAGFRKAMEAPEHSQYVHWGATSQDIIDTGLMLRLRQMLALTEADLKTCLGALAALAESHAETPMAARTWGNKRPRRALAQLQPNGARPCSNCWMNCPLCEELAFWFRFQEQPAERRTHWAQKHLRRGAALASALALEDPGRQLAC